MAPLLTYQPLKALYVFLAFCSIVSRLPLWAITILLRISRPHSKWSFRQTFMIKLSRTFLHHYSVVQTRSPLSLSPGKQKDRFIVLRPYSKPKEDLYSRAPLASNPLVKPLPVGATWYLRSPPARGSLGRPPTAMTGHRLAGPVILHVHGGAFVMGDGRPDSMSFLAENLIANTPCVALLSPQYRLSESWDAKTRFPAALQDILTCYAHLVLELGVPSERVVLSGDSAGANLVLALLRWLRDNADETSDVMKRLASPAACLLWSPWTNPAGAWHGWNAGPRGKSDYIGPSFGKWGVRSYCGDDATAPPVAVDRNDAYVSPFQHPFEAKGTKLWMGWGGAEVMAPEIATFAKRMKAVNNDVEVNVDEAAPHDIVLVGSILGWEEQAKGAARSAGMFLRQNIGFQG